MRDVGFLLLAFVLVFLNGFFVAAEFAIVKVRSTRIQERAAAGSWTAGVARGIIAHLDAYLSATQLGITLTSLALGWIGEPAFAHLIEAALGPLALPPAALHAAAFGIAFGTISFLHIVLGELAPKTLAISRPEATSMWVAVPLKAFYIVFFPAIWALNHAAMFALRIFGLQPTGEGDQAHSEEELRMIVAASHAQGELNATERDLLENVMEFSDRRITQIMVPRPDMICLDAALTLQENLAIVREHQHTRYPLVKDNKDNIVGMVHVKDLLDIDRKARNERGIMALKRSVLFVPESATIDHLLKTFQRKRNHMAVVVDEYGGVAGIVTLEDVLEEIVGEIRDEFDEVKDGASAINPQEAIVDASIPLHEAAQLFRFEFEEDDSINTIGGLVQKMLGHVPRVGESIEIGDYRVEVMQMEGLRLVDLRFRPLKRPATGGKPKPRDKDSDDAKGKAHAS